MVNFLYRLKQIDKPDVFFFLTQQFWTFVEWMLPSSYSHVVQNWEIITSTFIYFIYFQASNERRRSMLLHQRAQLLKQLEEMDKLVSVL